MPATTLCQVVVVRIVDYIGAIAANQQLLKILVYAAFEGQDDAPLGAAGANKIHVRGDVRALIIPGAHFAAVLTMKILGKRSSSVFSEVRSL